MKTLAKMSTPKSDSQLPIGLLTRRGTSIQLTSMNQRLPSIKCEANKSSHTPSPSAIAATTRGGYVKRNYKPTIPTARKSEETQVKDEIKKEKKESDMKKNLRGRKPRQGKDQDKKTMQLEAAVFSGVSTASSGHSKSASSSATYPSTSSSPFSSSSSGPSGQKKRSAKSCDTKSKHSKNKSEDNKEVLDFLYGDFIDDDDSDEDILLPKGWEAIDSKTTQSNDVIPLTPYNLLTNEDDKDKYLLMQIPDLICQKSEGYFGKMRVYKSGRIELEDEETGIKFDVLIDKNGNSKFGMNLVKSEDDKKLKFSNEGIVEPICQEIIMLSGNNLASIGYLNQNETLTVVPQVQTDK